MKRPLDFLIAVAALAILWPIILLTALAVRFFLGSPVLFRQTRPGLHAQPFELVKFRTMLEARSRDGALLPDDQRLTRFGRLLRASSLDELPQLWNVLRGDMSLVGPRPLLVDYLPRYSAHQARRHEVRPGITGWTQVNGRNALSWEEKLDLDVWYVDNHSLPLDLKIIFLTALRLLRPQGISAAGHATMPNFMGSGSASEETASGPKDRPIDAPPPERGR